MARGQWTDLPEQVRHAVQAHTGSVREVEPAQTGEHSDFAATLHVPAGRVFVKGSRVIEGPDFWSLCREAQINPHVVEFAPRLLWQVEAGGWLLLGFEHVDGRHADYSPGSPDLVHLARVVESFQAMACPEMVTRRVERRWADFADDVTPMAGVAMVHMDLNPANLLITQDKRVYVIDWGWTCKGAAWVELATLVQWLIGNGHSPQEAEDWLSQFPSWRAADPGALDLFARANCDRWRKLTADNPPAWAASLADWVQRWKTYRTG